MNNWPLNNTVCLYIFLCYHAPVWLRNLELTDSLFCLSLFQHISQPASSLPLFYLLWDIQSCQTLYSNAVQPHASLEPFGAVRRELSVWYEARAHVRCWRILSAVLSFPQRGICYLINVLCLATVPDPFSHLCLCAVPLSQLFSIDRWFAVNHRHKQLDRVCSDNPNREM